MCMYLLTSLIMHYIDVFKGHVYTCTAVDLYLAMSDIYTYKGGRPEPHHFNPAVTDRLRSEFLNERAITGY